MNLGSSKLEQAPLNNAAGFLTRPIRLEVNLGNYDDGPSFKPQASSFKQLDIKEIIGYSFKY